MKASLLSIPFPLAAAQWLETRKPYLAKSTLHDYTAYIHTLSKFFGELRLPEAADPELIRAYQRARLATAGASLINKETSVLQQMLKRIGAWKPIAEDFQPLPLPKEEAGQCIPDEHQARFFRYGLEHPEYSVATWASLISVNTTCGPGEILHLRLCDVDVERQLTIRVNAFGAKNQERIRVVALNDAALWAVKLFLARAQSLGSVEPEHFLIPFYQARGKYDPERPQTHYYKSFHAILDATQLNFRPYDFRHTAITRMLEAGVPEETVIAMAGHVSRKMLKRYSHIRLDAKRQAVRVLERKQPQSVKLLLLKTRAQK